MKYFADISEFGKCTPFTGCEIDYILQSDGRKIKFTPMLLGRELERYEEPIELLFHAFTVRVMPIGWREEKKEGEGFLWRSVILKINEVGEDYSSEVWPLPDFPAKGFDQLRNWMQQRYQIGQLARKDFTTFVNLVSHARKKSKKIS